MVPFLLLAELLLTVLLLAELQVAELQVVLPAESQREQVLLAVKRQSEWRPVRIHRPTDHFPTAADWKLRLQAGNHPRLQSRQKLLLPCS